jgi:hypothetical protein
MRTIPPRIDSVTEMGKDYRESIEADQLKGRRIEQSMQPGQPVFMIIKGQYE